MKKHYDQLEKTIGMKQWFNKSSFMYNDLEYQVIDFDVDFAKTPHHLFACIGEYQSDMREICIVDAKKINVPFLNANHFFHLFSNKDKAEYLLAFVSGLQKKTDIVEEMVKFVRFHPRTQLDLPPVIPLEEFREKQLMVCRHQALYLATLLGNMIKEGQLNEGSVRMCRAVLSKEHGAIADGGHTWVLYHDAKEDKTYLLDPMWKVSLNLDNEEQLALAKKYYGTGVIEQALARRLESEGIRLDKVVEHKSTSYAQANNDFAHQAQRQLPNILKVKASPHGELLKLKVKTPMLRQMEQRLDYIPPVQNKQNEVLDFYANVKPEDRLQPAKKEANNLPKGKPVNAKPKVEGGVLRIVRKMF